MRWFNCVLAVLVVTIPVFAGTNDGVKFGFNSGRQQIAASMNQPADDPAAQTNIDGTPKMVPGKALLLSAIVPGAGQFYAKNPIMAAAFLALEIGAWAGVAIYHGEGMDKEDEFMAYAEQHWNYYGPAGDKFNSYFEYEYWCANEFGSDGVTGTPSDDFTGGQDNWGDLTWHEKQGYLPQNGFTHELDPENKDQQYYEMIGKYGQFATG